MSTLIKWRLFSFCLVTVILSCSSCFYDYGPIVKPEPKTPKPQIEPTPSEPALSSEERESYAKACFNTAYANQIKYDKTRNLDYFTISINNYEKCYELSPGGEKAALAILSKVELYCDAGWYVEATRELLRFKSRRDLVSDYREEVQYLEERIKNRK